MAILTRLGAPVRGQASSLFRRIVRGNKHFSHPFVSATVVHHGSRDEVDQATDASLIVLQSLHDLWLHARVQICRTDHSDVEAGFRELFAESTHRKPSCRRFWRVRILCGY